MFRRHRAPSSPPVAPTEETIPRMRRPLAALVLAATLTLLVTGACSSDDAGTDGSPTTAPTGGTQGTNDAEGREPGTDGEADGDGEDGGPDVPGDDGGEGNEGDEGDEGSDDGPTHGSADANAADDAGGASSDPAAAPFVDAMVEDIVADDSFPATEAEARCIAESVVGAIGVDTLAAQGVTPEQFGDDGDQVMEDNVGPEEADVIGAAMVDCFEDPIALFAEAFAEGSPPEVQPCLEQELDEEELKVFFTQMLLVADEEMVDPPPEVLRMILELAQACPGLM